MKIHRLADPVPVTRDLLNPKSIDFDTVSRKTTVLSFESFRARSFSFIVLTYTPTHIHTHIHRDKVIAISAPPYYVVGAG